MPFKRPEDGFRFNFGGMKTNTAADEMPPTKYPFAQNVRYVKSLQTRPGYEVLFATALLIETDCPLTSGEVGVAYSVALDGVGGQSPYTWTIDSGSLPTGLSLSAAGVISGTPTTAQVASFVIKLTDSVATSILKSCQLTIAAAVAITTTCPLPDALQDVAYDEQLAATGGVLPYAWTISAGALPTGLSMDSSGEITGTPTVQQVSTFTIHVADAVGGSASLSCQITVQPTCFDFSDDFNRANGPLGSNWNIIDEGGSGVGPSIVSNNYVSSRLGTSDVVAAPTTNKTGWSQVELVTLHSLEGGPAALRNTNGVNDNRYSLSLKDQGGATHYGELRILRWRNHALLVLATYTPTIPLG